MSRDVFLQLRGCDKKWYIQRNPHSVSVPVYFYIGTCHPQITHTKLRLHNSDLNQDLVNRHVINDPSCKCGAASETVKHCLLHCTFYTQAFDYTVKTTRRLTFYHMCHWAVTQIFPPLEILQSFTQTALGILNGVAIQQEPKRYTSFFLCLGSHSFPLPVLPFISDVLRLPRHPQYCAGIKSSGAVCRNVAIGI